MAVFLNHSQSNDGLNKSSHSKNEEKSTDSGVTKEIEIVRHVGGLGRKSMERNQERLWFLVWATRCESKRSLRLETWERRDGLVGRGEGLWGRDDFSLGHCGELQLQSTTIPQPPWMRISLPRQDLCWEERWPNSQRRMARSLLLNGLLVALICTGIQVKLINHCQAVMIKQ